MVIRDDGLPVLATYDDSVKAALFAERLAAKIHPRLTHEARLFLSLEALGILLSLGVRALANEAAD